MIASMHRILTHIFERVVHPTHVPLHGEAQSPKINRTRNHRPGSGFLVDGECTGKLLMHYHVQLLDELQSLQVLAPTVLVWQPLAGLAGIVEVDHGSHGVHAQTVYVELIHPVVGVGDKEVAYFVAAVVENVSAPVLMLPDTRIFVLV